MIRYTKHELVFGDFKWREKYIGRHKGLTVQDIKGQCTNSLIIVLRCKLYSVFPVAKCEMLSSVISQISTLNQVSRKMY
jgi:hypothetical protein